MGDSVPTHPLSKTGGRPRRVNLREVVNGIFYILCGGCTWRMMPNDFQLGKRSIITSACGALLGVATDESGSTGRVRQQAGRQLTPVLP